MSHKVEWGGGGGGGEKPTGCLLFLPVQYHLGPLSNICLRKDLGHLWRIFYTFVWLGTLVSGGIVSSASRQYLLLSGVFLILDDYSRFSMISPSQWGDGFYG